MGTKSSFLFSNIRLARFVVAGSPGPRGLVLAHPFQGKYYDYRDPRVRDNLPILNWTLPHLLSNTQTFATTFAFGKYFAPRQWGGGDILQRDKNGCKCQATKGQIS